MTIEMIDIACRSLEMYPETYQQKKTYCNKKNINKKQRKETIKERKKEGKKRKKSSGENKKCNKHIYNKHIKILTRGRTISNFEIKRERKNPG